jgi:hypothetical protein
VQGVTRTGQKGKRLPPKFIAGVESWVYGYDPGTKEESSSCHPRELRQMKSGFKSMLCVFLNSEVIFWKEFFLQCQFVNEQFCMGVLRVLLEAVGRKCPTSGLHRTGFCFMTTHHGTLIHGFFQCLPKKKKNPGGGIWPLYFSILVFMAYSSSQRHKHG